MVHRRILWWLIPWYYKANRLLNQLQSLSLRIYSNPIAFESKQIVRKSRFHVVHRHADAQWEFFNADKDNVQLVIGHEFSMCISVFYAFPMISGVHHESFGRSETHGSDRCRRQLLWQILWFYKALSICSSNLDWRVLFVLLSYIFEYTHKNE